MNQRKDVWRQTKATDRVMNKKAGGVQPRKPGVAQPKMAAASQKKQPVAPPVYRPQPVPKVLQTKTVAPPQPARRTVQAGSAPVAPPVYRPQPVPKVLQKKGAPHQTSKTDRSPLRNPSSRQNLYGPRSAAPYITGPKQKGAAQPKITATAQAHKQTVAPTAYRPQSPPKVLQSKASRSASAQQNIQHRTQAKPNILARLGGHAVQARMSMDKVPNYLDYSGDPVGPDLNDGDVVSLLDSLDNDAGFTQPQIDVVEKVIEASPLYNFENLDHLNRFSSDTSNDHPTLVHDDEGAMMLDDVSGEFGSAFKKKGVPFSGSRVYAVAHSEGETSLWAMQNSATGYVTKANQQVVETWDLPEVHMPISFPSNTKAKMDKASLKRPTTMTGNAHAEVNEIVQHAYRSLHELKMHPHNVLLMFGSDIQHCAECFWAAQAMWKKGNKKPFNATGCGNRLFERWREPWDGFYKEYGDNPFRKPNGQFRAGFTKGEYQAHVLNKEVSGSLGNIYK